MKKFKSFISLLVCVGICIGISGCGGAKETSVEGLKSTEMAEKPTTITVFCPDGASMPMNSELTVIKELAEKTNTIFDFKVAPTTGASEKFNLMMVSGDIPDLVIYTEKPILKYKKAFEPLNELIEENCPNYLKLMEKYPSLKKDITAEDGNIYTMNSVNTLKFANAIIIRQDWLDNLGLKMPETLDEWYEVLKAFKEQDPNGNGKADEVSLVSPVGRYADAESPGLGLFMGAWGVEEEFYIEDNKVVYGAIDPRMKEAITWLNKLYGDGLLDTQYLTSDSARYDSLIIGEQAGVIVDWGICVDDFESKLETINPEVNFVIAPPPIGIDGERRVWSQMPSVRSNAIAISKESEEKEHIMEILNYVFSDEGYELMNYGVEGVTYTVEGENKVYTDEIMKSEKGVLPEIRQHGINSWFILEQSRGYEYSGEDFIKGIEMYEDGIIQPILPSLKFTDEEQKIINSKYTDIKTYKDESLDGFITGKLSIEEFDNYIDKMYTLGIQDVLDIYNTALQRYNDID